MSREVKLIVVEDDLIILGLLKALLTRCGYNVITCTSGEEALECLQAGLPDLLLTDIRMPGMDGISLAEAARVLESELPVLFVSGSVDEPDYADRLRQELADHERSDFLRKPFEVRELLCKVTLLLESRRPVLPAARSSAPIRPRSADPIRPAEV
jgi:CheY-like chemotaxis protein